MTSSKASNQKALDHSHPSLVLLCGARKEQSLATFTRNFLVNIPVLVVQLLCLNSDERVSITYIQKDRIY